MNSTRRSIFSTKEVTSSTRMVHCRPNANWIKCSKYCLFFGRFAIKIFFTSHHSVYSKTKNKKKKQIYSKSCCRGKQFLCIHALRPLGGPPYISLGFVLFPNDYYRNYRFCYAFMIKPFMIFHLTIITAILNVKLRN